MRNTGRHIFDGQAGFSLIELTALIIIVGILAAIAIQSLTSSLKDSRKIITEREMEALSDAIVGDPEVMSGGERSDFGYVGDVGAFPPNLAALVTNPGSYSTWNGPYLPDRFTQDTSDYKLDSWGKPYAYSGGNTITSTGSGSSIVKKLADATSDYLNNTVTGFIKDASDSVPGIVYMDSVLVRVVVPNGSGGTTVRSVHPDSSGQFSFANMPAGKHQLYVIYTPDADTLNRQMIVLPRNKDAKTYKFAGSYFSGGSTGSEWGRKCELLIQAAQVPGDLTYFPVLLTEVNLPSEMVDAGGSYHAEAGGGDIMFTSDDAGANHLACQIVTFTINSNPSLARVQIWVNVPYVSSSSNTPIWVWYNSPGKTQPAPSDMYGSEAVWDTNYVVIQHMDEDPSGSAPQMIDATSNNNDGSSYGNMTPGDLVTGQIGNCLDFDGNNDYVNINHTGVTVTGKQITMESWMNLGSSNGNQNLLERGTNYALWEIRGGGTPYCVFYNGSWQTGFRFGHPAGWFMSNWHHVACVYNGTQVITYIDGAQDRSYSYSSNLDPYSSNYDLGLGLNAGWNDAYYRGKIDEMRISKSARSATWIATQYNNQSSPSTFVIEGTPVTP